MPAQPSPDEQVARIVLDRIKGDARGVAAQRGLPAGMRHTNTDEELALFNEWDPAVDPIAVLKERLDYYRAQQIPDDAALTEAILDTCSVGFKNRLKMAGGAGRLTLTEQEAYLERMAKRSREARALATGEPTADEEGSVT